MRVAILLPDLRGGGAEAVMVSLAREFVSHGHLIDFVLMQARGELLADVPNRCRVIDLKSKQTRSAISAITGYLTAEKPDAVLSGIWPLTSAAALARQLARSSARLVVSDHNTLSRQYASWGRAHRLFLSASIATTYRLADARVAVSSGVADDIAELSGLHRDSFTVIHNPVPIAKSPEERGSASPAWPSNSAKRILSVGTLKPQKNHALLLRAFAAVSSECDSSLAILGEGPLRQELEDMVRTFGLTARVVLPGYVADPAPWYQSADLFVLASDYEGFGNVIVEALAAGVPVVSTDCPSGPAEILEGGRYGRLVPVGDSKQLANAILAALSATHDKDVLRARAAQFAPEIAARRYLDLLFPQHYGSAAE